MCSYNIHIQVSCLTILVSSINFCLLLFIAKFLLSEVMLRFSLFFWKKETIPTNTPCVFHVEKRGNGCFHVVSTRDTRGVFEIQHHTNVGAWRYDRDLFTTPHGQNDVLTKSFLYCVNKKVEAFWNNCPFH